MGTEQLTASDGFAIAMLAMVVASMGVLAMLGFCMFRNAARRDPQVDGLLEEMERKDRESRLPPPGDKPSRENEPWEKDADWWKP